MRAVKTSTLYCIVIVGAIVLFFSSTCATNSHTAVGDQIPCKVIAVIALAGIAGGIWKIITRLISERPRPS